jgi:hypothetical protein
MLAFIYPANLRVDALDKSVSARKERLNLYIWQITEKLMSTRKNRGWHLFMGESK